MNIEITINRSSVCMADDFENHETYYSVPDNYSATDVFRMLDQEKYLPEVEGNDEVWALTDRHAGFLAVYYTKIQTVELLTENPMPWQMKNTEKEKEHITLILRYYSSLSQWETARKNSVKETIHPVYEALWPDNYAGSTKTWNDVKTWDDVKTWGDAVKDHTSNAERKFKEVNASNPAAGPMSAQDLKNNGYRLMTEKEVKRLMTKIVLPSLGFRAFLALIVTGLEVIVFEYMKDMVFYDENSFMAGLLVYAGIAVIYAGFLCYTMVMPHFTYGQAAGFSNKKESLNTLSVVCHVKKPQTRLATFWIFVLPFLALVAVYAPEFSRANAVKQAHTEAACARMEHISQVMEKAGRSTYMQEPGDYYSKYGYNLFCYEDENHDDYMCINVDVDGIVTEVTYYNHIDIKKTPEENLEAAELSFADLYTLLNEAAPEESVYGIVETAPDTAPLKEALETSYYEEYYDRQDPSDNLRIYYGFYTQSEEDFTEYSDPYVYVSIEEK